MTIDKGRCVCGVCDWRGRCDDLLVAASPFDPADSLTGCPKCKAVNSAEMICDEVDCWHHIVSGMNTLQGYRQTCHQHAPRPGAALVAQ